VISSARAVSATAGSGAEERVSPLIIGAKSTKTLAKAQRRKGRLHVAWRFFFLCVFAPLRELFLREHPPQHGTQLRECSGPMAQCVLHARAQLAESAMVFGNEEQWIVAEAAAAARFTNDDAVTTSLDDRLDFALGVGQCRGANVMGGTTVVGQRRQLGEQLLIIRFIVPLPT